MRIGFHLPQVALVDPITGVQLTDAICLYTQTIQEGALHYANATVLPFMFLFL